MEVVDANVVLYAVNEAAPHHQEAREWLNGALSGAATIGWTWMVLLAFVRLATRLDLFPRPLSLEAALAMVNGWLGQPASVVVEPTSRHFAVMASLLRETGTGGNLVNDAHLAAIALEHQATIVTYDNDFDRFSGVRWQRPSSALAT